MTNDFNVYPIRAYLAGYDNALEIVLFQKDSDLDYICVEDTQGYSVSVIFVIIVKEPGDGQ